MIIGVDARELEGKRTGVGIYLRNILERIRIPEGCRLQLFFKNEIPSDLAIPEAERALLRFQGSNLLWQQWHLRKELLKRKVSLFFSPAATAPWYYNGIQVITIHDLSFFLYPHWFSAKERITRQWNAAISLRRADRIYAVSPLVREELMARFDLPPSRIVITSNGVTAKNAQQVNKQLLKESYDLANLRVVLYVGSIFNRRHLPVLLKAAARLKGDILMVIIGENRTHPHQNLTAIVRELGLQQRVRLLEYVPEKVLNDYYRMADLFVYLSDYEGFGIPPLEAMSYGIPVILSERPAMDVLYRDAAFFVRDISAERVSQAIEHCLNDAGESEQLIRRGKALADHYTWEDTARIISEDWEQLLVGH